MRPSKINNLFAMFVIWDLQIKEVWPPTKKFIKNQKKMSPKLLR